MLRPVPAEAPPERRGRFPARIVATLALAALAVLVWTRDRSVAEQRERLFEEVRAAGVGGEELRGFAAGAYRETDPARIEIEAARLLLNREIERPGPWDPAATRERFGRVMELARRAGVELPALSRAFSVYASALVQLRTRTADTRLFSQHRQWERPLEHAIELDPADRFPKETLSFVYLEVWPAIAPEKRPEVEQVLREAFQEEGTFNSLIGKWIAIAGSLDAAARIVPDTPWAWRAFVEEAGRRRDLAAFVRYRARHRAAVGAAVDKAIDEAERRIAANNPGYGRQLLDDTFASLPIDAESAPRLERILGRRPAGPAGRNAAQAAAAWLDWLEPLVLIGRDPLSGEAVGRLAFLAAGEVPPEKAAFASLAAGDLGRAELFERRSDALWSERWAPYLTLKARLLLSRGETAAARSTLERAHRDFHPRLAWSVLAQSVGLPPPRTAAGTLRARGPASSWTETDWFWKEGDARLELLPERAANALAVELARSPEGGGVLEILWDGVPAGIEVLSAESGGRLTLDLAITREPHLLQLRALAGALPPTARISLR